jgi:hypothetical protein
MSTIRSVQCHSREWLAKSPEKGAGEAQGKLLEDTKPESWAYLRLNTKDGYRYGGMHGKDLAVFAAVYCHAFEIVPTDRRRKFYLDYDIEFLNAN